MTNRILYLKIMEKNQKFRLHKKLRLFVFAIILAGICFGSSLLPASRDRRTSLVHDGIKRTFNIFFPSFYNDSLHMPILITLHGKGGNGKSMEILTRRGFEKLAEKEGFLVIYPDGIELNWNDGRTDEESKDRAHTENIDDVGFISDLIDFMIGNYNADPRRVFITGISNGAIMAYRLACELSDKITAIAPVDGNIPVMIYPGCNPSFPVSVLTINNVNDPLVPFEGGDIHSSLLKVKLGKVLSVEKSVEFWVTRDKCSGTPEVTKEPDRDPGDGTRVTRTLYPGGIDGTEVLLYSIDGGGHTWPGGIQYKPAAIIGKTCRDIDACEVIWSFFKRLSK